MNEAISYSAYADEVRKALALYHQGGDRQEAEAVLLALRDRLHAALEDNASWTEHDSIGHILLGFRTGQRLRPGEVDPLWEELHASMREKFEIIAGQYATFLEDYASVLREAGRREEGDVLIARAVALSAVLPEPLADPGGSREAEPGGTPG